MIRSVFGVKCDRRNTMRLQLLTYIQKILPGFWNLNIIRPEYVLIVEQLNDMMRQGNSIFMPVINHPFCDRRVVRQVDDKTSLFQAILKKSASWSEPLHLHPLWYPLQSDIARFIHWDPARYPAFSVLFGSFGSFGSRQLHTESTATKYR